MAPSDQNVAAPATLYNIPTAVGGDAIVASSSNEEILSSAAANVIDLAPSSNAIGSAPSHDHVSLRRADQNVIPTSADDRCPITVTTPCLPSTGRDVGKAIEGSCYCYQYDDDLAQAHIGP